MVVCDGIRVNLFLILKYFPLDELDPILMLASSWHKLEFESWPALLDELQLQFEMNAAKVTLVFSSHFIFLLEYRS